MWKLLTKDKVNRQDSSMVCDTYEIKIYRSNIKVNWRSQVKKSNSATVRNRLLTTVLVWFVSKHPKLTYKYNAFLCMNYTNVCIGFEKNQLILHSEKYNDFAKKNSSIEVIIWRYIFAQNKALSMNGCVNCIFRAFLYKITGSLQGVEELK